MYIRKFIYICVRISKVHISYEDKINNDKLDDSLEVKEKLFSSTLLFLKYNSLKCSIVR